MFAASTDRKHRTQPQKHTGRQNTYAAAETHIPKPRASIDISTTTIVIIVLIQEATLKILLDTIFIKESTLKLIPES